MGLGSWYQENIADPVKDAHYDAVEFLTFGAVGEDEIKQAGDLALDAVTGGAISAEKAAEEAEKERLAGLDAATRYQAEAAAQARKELMNLFPYAQQRAGQGYQGALDLFGQTIPAQTQAFQGGNVAAQEAILAGLPQIQNAILGMPVDLSGLQTYQSPSFDMSMFQQQLPEQQSIADLLAAAAPADNSLIDDSAGFFESLLSSDSIGTIGYDPLAPAQDGTYLQDAMNTGRGDTFASPTIQAGAYDGLNIAPITSAIQDPVLAGNIGQGALESLAGLQNLNIPTIDFNALAGLRNLNIG